MISSESQYSKLKINKSYTKNSHVNNFIILTRKFWMGTRQIKNWDIEPVSYKK